MIGLHIYLVLVIKQHHKLAQFVMMLMTRFLVIAHTYQASMISKLYFIHYFLQTIIYLETVFYKYLC